MYLVTPCTTALTLLKYSAALDRSLVISLKLYHCTVILYSYCTITEQSRYTGPTGNRIPPVMTKIKSHKSVFVSFIHWQVRQ